MNFVKYYGINPKNVVIEIIESDTDDILALQRFIELYRGFGFLIALDDVGAGCSNLDRIIITKPDIIKFDRALISGIHNFFYKQEICRALINLSRKIGALVVAEGVEEEREVITCLDLGVDILQGYYFMKPMTITDDRNLRILNQRIEGIVEKFKSYKLKKIDFERNRRIYFEQLLEDARNDLSALKAEEMNALLSKVAECPSVECIYVLDNAGIQVSETVCNQRELNRNAIFYPAKRGTDHSLRDFYYLLSSNEQEFYFSDPYISMASGSLTITGSARMQNQPLILCIDFIYD
ncbi:hypothetical protein N752_25785 [Desulforamulus aquiferis]|nr:EAL domain-containing protein [Desulforamulus aquiferis]RYD02226.1 hypothetical protein N752_25785 [Desulforamulus aquiferis]